jgi:hypothetical protein
MICPWGRIFTPEHPVCRSHLRQGADCRVKAKKKIRANCSGGPFEKNGRRGWFTNYDLQSPNAHVNRINGEKIYRGIKKTWGRVLTGAVLHFGPAAGRRRRLEVVRFIPSRGWSYDEDNLWGACKPLVDQLTLQGVLVDDTREWLEWCPPREIVDPSPRVEIYIEEVSCEKDKSPDGVAECPS